MLMCALIILVASLYWDELHFIVSVFCNYGCQSYKNYWPAILKAEGSFMKECQEWKEFSANYEQYCYKTVWTVAYL